MSKFKFKQDEVPTIKYVKVHVDAVVPTKLTPGSAGWDISVLAPNHGVRLAQGAIRVFKTGLKVEVPAGYELQIRSRSGLSTKGVVVVNSPGTIDSDFRGELEIVVGNYGSQTFDVTFQARMAQVVLVKLPESRWEEVEELSSTARQESGLGSTGVAPVKLESK